MQTKSNIQLIRESLRMLETFKINLESYMERWTIEDSYFTPNKTIMGCPSENCKGYFSVKQEYTNINEAISNMTLDQTIRIIENKRFQVGNVFEKLTDATGDDIIDITTGEQVKND